jgi:hypothetical protein
MTPATNLVQAILSSILTGIGIGTFFFLPMFVQNVLPASSLGVGTAATRYLGQLGAALGIAIVGTVVSSSISGDLVQHLPTNQTGKLLLSTALQHGFVAVLIFAVIALVATFFLKEVSLKTAQDQVVQMDEESTEELVYAEIS